MLGTESYKIQIKGELSNERLKSLIFFYEPLIGNDALFLYEFFYFRNNDIRFKEINELLSSLNISVDEFEKRCNILNEYKLVATLKKGPQYVFKIREPLLMEEFIKNDLFVRNFILKTSGKYYQELLADIKLDDNYNEFEDISKNFDASNLQDWSKSDETYLNNNNKESYNFNTIFNVNTFLKNVSTNLFPMRLRTENNLRQLATLADLYNISYDKMSNFLIKACKLDSDSIDFNYLKYMCIHTNSDYQKVDQGNYNVPCLTYLMSLQEGKEATEYDKNIIYKLSNDYRLNPSVINVLLEHCLKNCDNRLIEKYIYGVASDLHRNDIKTAKQALERLDIHSNYEQSKEQLPKYDTSKNPALNEQRLAEILNRRAK